MSLHYLKKGVRDELDFWHADKHQSFLQFGFDTWSIKIYYKVILSLLMGMIKHSQSTQSNKFVISLQYFKKEVKDWIYFLHADKHQSFCRLVLSFLMEMARYVQSTQNRKLVMFLEKSIITASLFYCDAKHSVIYWSSVMFGFTCCKYFSLVSVGFRCS